jgi:predicted cobalt transporter CbtA
MFFTHAKQRIRIALPAMLVLALAATPAHAASSSTSAYSGQGDVLDQTINGTSAGSGAAPTTSAGVAPVSAAQPAEGSQLPFTGFDVTLLIIGGAVLVGIGFGMRRLARMPEPR